VELIRRFCAERVPAEVADHYQLDVDVRGGNVTISERRPPWAPELGPEWTSSVVAQLRFDRSSRRWALHWADRNGRWNPYEDIPPTADVAELLAEVSEDPTGIFWG
jgi:hypothetical protein